MNISIRLVTKVTAILFVSTLLQFLMVSPALAIDCSKAVDAVDRKICANPSLVADEAAMSRAYVGLVRAAPDREIHDMLVNSQRRWVKARKDWVGRGDVATGAIHNAIVDRTRRLNDRSGAGLNAQAQAQQKMFSKYKGGAFAGFRTTCEFTPDDPTRKQYSYICMGVVQAQNNDRICSIESDWATWRIYTYLGISELKDGKAVPVASCDLGGGCDLTKDVGWKRGAEIEARELFPPATGLPKLDAEADFLDVSDDFLDKCLTLPRYPAGS